MQSDIREMSSAALLKMHELDASDLARVRDFGKFTLPRLDHYLERFYLWVKDMPEYQVLFASPETVTRAKAQQHQYWQSFLNAQVDEMYIESRRHVGRVHARIGLSLPSYMAAMNYSFVMLATTLYQGEMSEADYAAAVSSLTKLLHLDVTIVSETYSRMVNEQIVQQGKALLLMSTPVTQIWEDILMLPMVGVIDSKRAQDVMSTVLAKVFDTRAKVFIMDISGVAVVDSAVANHLIKITKSTGLMGCTSLVSGISPAIAQTMVNLGFDVSEISTCATLRDALESAFQMIGRCVS